MATLNPKIVEKLAKELSLTTGTVKKNIYSLARTYPKATPNALAQYYASQHGKSVLRMLSDDDRSVFPSSNTNINYPIPTPKSLRVIQIGRDQNRWYNNPYVQLFIAFVVVGIIAGTISEVLGIYIANLLGLH